MFRLPKKSHQSPVKRLVVTPQKRQGLCKFPHRQCNLLSLENFEYCLKHILEDKSAPYKPCPFLYTVSGKKCGKPAHRPDRKDTWFCAEHSRKSQCLRQKASIRHAPPKTPEALLASLSHYARTEQSSATCKREENENEESARKHCSQAINPFVEVDAAQVNARSSQVLDYASDSDSDVEQAMLDSVWRAQDHESSDAESIDSQAEDLLKHAEVFTAEEATIVIKDKMIRLQSLYIDQFRRLHHLLKERRRKYLHALKKEKETLCSIHNQEKTSGKEQKLYLKLKALNHFHKCYGGEAVLHKKAWERRAQVTESALPRPSHKGKCAFTEGGVKCGAKTLPATKYCQKHILEDTQQVLFRACGFKRDDHTCQEPTLNIFENATCVYHITLPAHPHNSLDTVKTKEEVKAEILSDEKTKESSAAETLATVKVPNIPEEEDLFKPIDPDVSMLKPTEPVCMLKATDPVCTLKPTEPVTMLKPTEPATMLKPTEPVCMLKPTESVSMLKPTEHVMTPEKSISSLLTPAEPLGCTPKASEVAGITDTDSLESVRMLLPEQSDVTQAADEKLDVSSEIVSIKSGEMLQHESTEDELVMVDMMTDVGVVEEILETEVKTEPEESMQLGIESDSNLENR